MHVDRRNLIKGMCLTGISGMISGGIAATVRESEQRRAPSSRPVTLNFLVAGSRQDEAFLDGASRWSHRLGAHFSVTRLKSPLCDDLIPASALIRTRQPIVALVGPADGIILQELARGAGLRLSFLGDHRVGGSDWAHHHHLIGHEPSPASSPALSSARMPEDGEQAWSASLAGSLVQVACGARHPLVRGRQVFRGLGERAAQRPEVLTSLLIQA